MSRQRAEKAESFLRRVSPHASLESLESPQDIVAKLLPESPLPPEHVDLAESAARKFATGAEMSPPEVFALEAIIIPDKRPAIDIINGDYTVSHKDWLHFNKDADVPIKTNIRRAIPSIGRIELPHHPTLPYGGTGFVVGDGLLMTNRHVAEIFSSGLGIRNLVFRAGYETGVDFLRERDSTTSHILGIRRVVMIHPFWDMALLHVDGLLPAQAPLRLSLQRPEEMSGRDVAVVGYPAFDPRNDAKVQDTVFGGVYYVKRLQPGKLRGRRDIESFGKNVPATTHDASTLGGNSGSAVIDPASGCVIGLHFAGVYLDANFAVPTFELARDPRVVDAGLNFERPAQPETRIWDDWWARADADESASINPKRGKPGANAGRQNPASPASDPASGLPTIGDTTWTLPVEITVRMRHLGGPARASASGIVDVEKMVAPIHDADYSDRHGYDPDFLGMLVPPPAPTDKSLVSRMDDGQYLIPYHHFSLAIHKVRRLALFTASNLDADKKSKAPEGGHSYSRGSLGGLGENDTELWFQDPRIPAVHQLPDRFFTKDHGAFDKGHLVRREDVAWGRTFQEVQFANGDTFHTTNCSPQIGKFNRPDQKTNWGVLENYVFKNAGQQKLCVFAGPVLSPDDHTFVGSDDRGPVRVQIPSRFWKIVVSADEGKLQSFGFLLKQDLSNVPLEFAVASAWKQLMIPIARLEQTLGCVQFPGVMHDADQASTPRGATVRRVSGVEMIAATEMPAASRAGATSLKPGGLALRDSNSLSEGPITFRDHFASLYQSAVAQIARKTSPGPVSGLEAAGSTAPDRGADLILAAEKVVAASRSPPGSRATTTEPSGGLEKMTVLDRAQTCAALGWELMRAKLSGDTATVASVQEELTAGTCDPLWAQTIEEYVRYFGPNGTRKLPIYVEPKDAGGPIAIPSGATIAIIGDWGTGAGPAIGVLAAVRENKPDVIIHLGDIYYSGTPDECRASFEGIFDHVFGSGNRPPVYTLCGNHDMYCGGVGFYGLIDRLNGGEKRQKASFFSLRSEDERWQLLAMDTGRNDYSPFSVTDVVTFVEPAEEEWHVQRLKEFSGRTILFSHHQLFSAFSQIGAPGADGTLRAHNVKLKRTYDRLLATGRPVSAWFWGHEHNLCIYEPYLGLAKGRCVGHGAIPVFVADEPYTPLPSLASPPRIIADTTLSTEDHFYTHGFAMLSLGSKAADARYYELVHGNLRCIHTEQIT